MDRQGERSGEDRSGLVSLGLLMELAGSIIAAYLIVQALEPALDRVFAGRWYPRPLWQPYDGWGHRRLSSAPPWHVTMLAAVGVVRALLHRRAGSAVLYRSGGGASAVATYVVVAVGHAALCTVVFAIDLDHQSLGWAAIACMSLAWPLALLLAIRRPALRGALDEGPAATRGSAPDQVGTLMTFLGLLGALIALFLLYAAIDAASPWSRLWSGLTIGVASLLCVRALAHVIVGFRVAGRAGSSEPLDVSGYVRVGLVTSALAWAAILILLHRRLQLPPSRYVTYDYLELGRSGMLLYLLVLWPLLLRRLARARGDGAALPVTAPPRSSAALPALGWLLLAAGTAQLGVALVELGLGEGRVHRLWAELIDAQAILPHSSRPPWVQLLIAVPQLWVAIELLRGSARRRGAATLYAACASVATVLSIQADVHYLMRAIGAGLPGATIVVAYLPLAFSLVVPVATLVFVQHHLRREDARAPAVSMPEGA